ncbi:MAG: hypothetical protein A2Y25_10910 [Candidatus Melainabacteria bacterium GWF2_37_15]|nr:MAG: hypothetical protein A2Y25_10910 [Candidatus Melainabacteria bacterium GWF2_37_15]
MDIFILICLFIVIILLVKSLIEPTLAFLGLLIFYFLLDLITVNDLLGSFVNTSIITLMLLIIIADVLARTQITSLTNRVVGTKKRNVLGLGVLVSFLSSFLSNTLVVQMFINMLNKKEFKSRLLLPVSYLAILGGTTTLIGTSTNLIAQGFMIQMGLQPFKFLDFAYVGIPLVFAGIIYLTFFSPIILKHKPNEAVQECENYFLEARVLEGSSLNGKTIMENGLRNLHSLFLAEIIRHNKLISPVKPDELVLEGDILVFTGDIENINELQKFNKLEIFEQKNDVLCRNLVWAVLSHNSSLVNQKIKECNFRRKFDAAIVAIKREGESLRGKIGEITLKAGDHLILAVGENFLPTREVKSNFYLLNDLETVKKFDIKNSMFIYFSFLLLIVLSALNLIDLLKGLFVLLFLYMILKFITFKDVIKNINVNLLILLGSALGISKVLVSNGASELISNFILYISQNIGVYGTFIAIYFLSIVLTEFTLNACAVAIAFPIAYLTAISLGVSPTPFIFAVTYGASASFLTKFGYQTNMMVSAAGNYKAGDFIRLGLPLSIIYAIIVLTLVPVFFKF